MSPCTFSFTEPWGWMWSECVAWRVELDDELHLLFNIKSFFYDKVAYWCLEKRVHTHTHTHTVTLVLYYYTHTHTLFGVSLFHCYNCKCGPVWEQTTVQLINMVLFQAYLLQCEHTCLITSYHTLTICQLHKCHTETQRFHWYPRYGSSHQWWRRSYLLRSHICLHVLQLLAG